jgi:hypothetical protein
MASDFSSQSSLYLIPGMKAELWIPINEYNNTAMFPISAKTYKVNGIEYELKNSFYEESQGTVGELTRVLDDKFGVEYWHKRPEKNAIWYISAHPNIRVLWSIISVPIHDHSSIVQGGPAYGTYFSDDVEARGE